MLSRNLPGGAENSNLTASVPTAGPREIPNTKQEYQPLGRKVRWRVRLSKSDVTTVWLIIRDETLVRCIRVNLVITLLGLADERAKGAFTTLHFTFYSNSIITFRLSVS